MGHRCTERVASPLSPLTRLAHSQRYNLVVTQGVLDRIPAAHSRFFWSWYLFPTGALFLYVLRTYFAFPSASRQRYFSRTSALLQPYVLPPYFRHTYFTPRSALLPPLQGRKYVGLTEWRSMAEGVGLKHGCSMAEKKS